MYDRSLLLAIDGIEPDLWPVEITVSEQYSKPGTISAIIYCKDRSLSPSSLINRRVGIKANLPEQGTRYFSGWVMAADEQAPHWFELSITSWLGRLADTSDCRGFVDSDVRAVTDAVIKDLPPLLRGDMNWNIRQDLITRDYWAQFNESHLGFLSRLWHEAGIAYWVEYTSDKQIIHLFDNSSAYKQVLSKPLLWPGESYHDSAFRLANASVKHELTAAHALRLLDIYPEQSTEVEDVVSNTGKSPLGLNAKRTTLVLGDNELKLSDTRAKAKRMAFASQQSDTRLIADSHVLGLSLGQQFELDGCTDSNKTWLPIAIEHYLQDYSYLEERRPPRSIVPTELGTQGVVAYQNHISAVPSIHFPNLFLPECEFKRPLINDPMSAEVVAPEGKAIYCDDKGRVKVWFPWDRNNPHKVPEICPWARLMDMQGGNGWGQQFIPRAGNEVVVKFINGTLRRPIVRGCLYNAKNRPPFKHEVLPGLSGIRTQALSPKLGAGAGHSIIFDDTAKAERIIIHSAGDMQREAVNYQQTIHGNHHVIIDGESALKVLNGSYHIKASDSITLQAGPSKIVINNDEILFEGPEVNFELPGQAKPLNIATVGDKQKCPKRHIDLVKHEGGDITTGHTMVTIDGQPVARIGDKAECHDATATITTGHPAFTIDGVPVATLESETNHNGKVITAHPKVGTKPNNKVAAPPPPAAPATKQQFKQEPQKLKLEGIETIRVVPHARILAPNGKVGDSLTLANLPSRLQQSIVSNILEAHCPKTPDDATSAKLPKDYQHWDKLIKDKSLVEQAKDALEVSQAPLIDSGWLYVFGHCPQVPHQQFSKMHCFKEYKLKNDDGELYANEVNLAKHGGLDVRPSEDIQTDYIELPYQYVKNKQPQGKFQVQVIYSPTQLSWARLAKYGGLAKTDPRLSKVKDHKAKDNISKVQAKTQFDVKLLQQRAGHKLKAESLDAVYQVQYKQQAPKPIASKGLNKYQDQATHDVFYTKKTEADKHNAEQGINTNNYPHLLLDAPSQQVSSANQLMTNLLNHLQLLIGLITKQKDDNGINYGNSAIFALQLFMRYNYAGIYKDNGTYKSIKTQQPLTWQKAGNDIAKSKLLWYVNYYSREIIHGIYQALQQQTTDFLLQNWNQKTKQPKPFAAKGPWHINLDTVITDSFATSTIQFGSGYIFLQGLVLPSCIDSRNYDQKLRIDNSYVDESTLSFPRVQMFSGESKSQLLKKHFTRLSNYSIAEQDDVSVVTARTPLSTAGIAGPTDITEITTHKPSKIIQLAKPAGLHYLAALHNPSFPHHQSFFNSNKDKAEQIYFEAKGRFNKDGFKAAWLDVDKPKSASSSTRKAIGGGNKLFKLVFTSYIQHAMYASALDQRKKLTAEVLAEFGQQKFNDYFNLIQEAEPTIESQILSVKQKARAKLHESLNEPAKDKAATITGPIAIALTIWQLQDDVIKLKKNTDIDKSLNLMTQVVKDFVSTVSQVKGLYKSVNRLSNDKLNQMAEQTASKLIFDRKYYKWLSKTKIATKVEAASMQLTQAFPAIEAGWAMFGAVTSVTSAITSTLGLVSYLTASGRKDPAKLISDGLGTLAAAGGAVKAGQGVNSTLDAFRAGVKTAQAADIGLASTDMATTTVAEVSTTSFLAELFGTTNPVGWVFDISIAILSLASLVASFFEHDKYQNWVANSPFTKKENNLYFKSDMQSYNALLGLLFLPSVTTKLGADGVSLNVDIQLPGALLSQSIGQTQLQGQLYLMVSSYFTNPYATHPNFSHHDSDKVALPISAKADAKGCYSFTIPAQQVNSTLAKYAVAGYVNCLVSDLAFKLVLKDGQSLPAFVEPTGLDAILRYKSLLIDRYSEHLNHEEQTIMNKNNYWLFALGQLYSDKQGFTPSKGTLLNEDL